MRDRSRYGWEGDAFKSWRVEPGTLSRVIFVNCLVTMRPKQILSVEELEKIFKEEKAIEQLYHTPSATEVLHYFAGLVDSTKIVLLQDTSFKSVGTTGRR